VKDTSLAAAGSEGSVTYSFGGIVIHMKFCDSYSLGGNYAAIELLKNVGILNLSQR
jgi:hypothetical protein